MALPSSRFTRCCVVSPAELVGAEEFAGAERDKRIKPTHDREGEVYHAISNAGLGCAVPEGISLPAVDLTDQERAKIGFAGRVTE
jgi:hypothetical protein